MSEPLYSSSFEYTTQNLDFKEQSKEICNDGINQALMEFYENRNSKLIKTLGIFGKQLKKNIQISTLIQCLIG